MKPAAVATYLADYAEAMKYVGEEVAVTRAGATAALTISSIAHDSNGMLSINVTPIGLEPQAGYAFALDIEADGNSYCTTYTPTFLMVDSDRIGVNGLYASMGTVTVVKYMQLFVEYFPEYTTNRGITLTTSDPTRATISPSGILAIVEGAPNGEFTITVTTQNGKTATLKFKVVDLQLQIDTDLLVQSMAQ